MDYVSGGSRTLIRGNDTSTVGSYLIRQQSLNDSVNLDCLSLDMNRYINIQGVYNETTVSAGNVFIDTDVSLRRSTLSLKCKKDIKYLKPEDIKILYNMKPFTYADKAGNENEN